MDLCRILLALAALYRCQGNLEGAWQSGGGILSTLTATRASSFEDLIIAALPRVDALIAEGVTTLDEVLRVTREA
jgi:imidazolonepropionase-like amidohydrolase